ncbi:MAG: EAL domain-containing protein [Gammaproteobacteria bacterium]|nr:EAL domain-containing protein [Gammaproteobacteria bacterium]
MTCEYQVTCGNCEGDERLGFEFTMAFQPIVDVQKQEIFGYEALVRGLNNESAYSVISQVNEDNRYLFDQTCRTKAITLAAQLKMQSMLSINFLPNAVYQPERCIRTTLECAKANDFPIENIMFEFTEAEKVEDTQHIKRIVQHYQGMGFTTATDDFGAGYSGLNLLADFQPDIVKLDMELIRNIETDHARQVIVRNCIAMMTQLNVTVLAEGIETEAELNWIKDAGVKLVQGYYFAKPELEKLPDVHFSN